MLKVTCFFQCWPANVQSANEVSSNVFIQRMCAFPFFSSIPLGLSDWRVKQRLTNYDFMLKSNPDGKKMRLVLKKYVVKWRDGFCLLPKLTLVH